MSQHTMIPVAGDDIPVIFDDLTDFLKARQHWQKQVESRLKFPNDKGYDDLVEDAYLNYREDDSGRGYYEWVAPSLHEKGYRYPTKRMSQSSDKKAEFPFFIAFMTPWVRYNSKDKQNEVLYTAFQLETGAEKLEAHGFSEDDAGQWVPAKRVEVNDTYVWKAL